MSENIRYELQLVAISMLTGMGLIIVYDCLRISRLFIKHKWFWIGLEDLVYWIYATVITFSLLYRQSDGALRSYTVGSVLIGMLFYNHFISRKILNLLKKIIKYFKMKLCKRRDR